MSLNPISLSYVQGDDKSFPVTVSSPGSPTVVDLSGSIIKADIRKEYTTAVIGSFNITETDLSTGQFSLDLVGSETALFPINKSAKITSYVFDVQITYPSTKVETIITGYLKMQHQVTA